MSFESVGPGRDPKAEYETRRATRSADVARLESVEARLANLRLILFVAAALALWFLAGRVPLLGILAPAAVVFMAMVVVHERTKNQLDRARAAVRYYETGLDRLEYRFAGSGVTGNRWLDETHPYAIHLDIFGVGSLYEFLCGSRTVSGRETLARWLLEPADAEEILARQSAATELAPRLDLREDLAVLDTVVLDAFASEEVVAWGAGPDLLSLGPARIAALGLSALTIAAAIAGFWFGAAPLVWVLVINLLFWRSVRRRVEAVIKAAERPTEALRLIHGTLARLEQETFECERLRRISRSLGDHEPPPSEGLETLIRRLNALEARQNDLFLPVALALLWGTNGAFAIEGWRQKHGPQIGTWIEAVGELEALLDLGRLAYERPDYCYPTLRADARAFRADGIAHPLLGACTPNDVALGDGLDLLVVTGSNMSGKSTLLRTVGVNAVLAQAGAPVRAKAMELSPLAIGASIRTLDSLQDGASRFYAEIHAIKRAMDAAENEPPGLFLLDELLHGTNSHDRRIGAESILAGFLERGALGIATTHDLALAAIADELEDRALNAHFEFSIEGDEIQFDYTLHPGVVQTGNALAIMRAAGLEI